MKKLFTLVAVAGMFTFVACGPSAAEKEAADKLIADSIAAVDAAKAAEEAAAAQVIADSTAAYATDEAAKAQAITDSIAAAGSKKK